MYPNPVDSWIESIVNWGLVQLELAVHLFSFQFHVSDISRVFIMAHDYFQFVPVRRKKFTNALGIRHRLLLFKTLERSSSYDKCELLHRWGRVSRFMGKFGMNVSKNLRHFPSINSTNFVEVSANIKIAVEKKSTCHFNSISIKTNSTPLWAKNLIEIGKWEKKMFSKVLYGFIEPCDCRVVSLLRF